MNAPEVWKSVVGYEGLYEVSNHAQVRSLPRFRVNNKNGQGYMTKGKIMTRCIGTTGYYMVGLTDANGNKKKVRVHRIVAKAFIPNPCHKPEINHIDGDKLNCAIENLEWCTQKENINHALETHLIPNIRGREKQVIQYYLEDQSHSVQATAHHFGVGHQAVTSILKTKEIKIRPISSYNNKYHIDRKKLASEFEKGTSNKKIASIFKANTSLIARYKYLYKKGELNYD